MSVEDRNKKPFPNRVAEVMRTKHKRITSLLNRTGLSEECLRAIIDERRLLTSKTASRIAKVLQVLPAELFATKVRARSSQARLVVPADMAQLGESERQLLIELCTREENELRAQNRNVVADLYAGMAKKLRAESAPAKVAAPKPEPEATAAPVKPKGNRVLSDAHRVPISRPFTMNELGDMLALSVADKALDAVYFAGLLKRPESDVKLVRVALSWLITVARNNNWTEERMRMRLAEWLPSSAYAHIVKG